MRGRRVLLAMLAAAGLAFCTPVSDVRVETVTIRVDADEEVRLELEDVQVVVESRTRDASSWKQEVTRRFNPSPSDPNAWPLEFALTSFDASATYQVTATARDQADALKIQARAIVEPKTPPPHELRLRFDRECLRRSTVCGRTLSCAFGECIDAREPLRDPISARSERGTTKPGSLTSELPMGGQVAQSCSQEGLRTCALDDTLQPLICQQATWQPLERCAEDKRCDLGAAETLGTCQPVATECVARGSGALFCDATGAMHTCAENLVAHMKPCGDNEHCVEVNRDVRCNCLPGFVPDARGCVEARDCTGSGGCDPQTHCEMRNAQRVCTPCPSGFSGSGEVGCAPLLSSLSVSPGVLEPAFAPDVKEYHVRLPLLVPTISVTAQSETGASLTINEENASVAVPWSSSILPAGQTTIPVVLRAQSGVRADYRIIVEHSDTERTYFKGSSCQRGGWFGEYFAVFGDTMVVGAPLESVTPAARTALSSAGAAYVYVRENGKWREQQRLVADEPVTDGSFGMGVAVWGNHIAVGAPGGVFTILGTGTRNGSVSVFVRNGDKWTTEQVIESGNPQQTGDAFGFRVALRANELIATAPFDAAGGRLSGAMYVYRFEGDSWKLQQPLRQPMPVTDSHYGVAVATDGDTLVVGATHETINGNSRAGAVYIYRRNAEQWAFAQRLLAPTVRTLAQFGYSVATLGETLVVSAPHNPAETTSNRSGEVHVFQREGGEYKPVDVIELPQPSVGDYFGNSVALNDSWLAVGATRDAPQPRTSQDGVTAQGKVYLYGRAGQRFVRATQLRAGQADEEDHFGDVVALADDYIAIGVREEDSASCRIDGDATDNAAADSGAVYVVH